LIQQSLKPSQAKSFALKFPLDKRLRVRFLGGASASAELAVGDGDTHKLKIGAENGAAPDVLKCGRVLDIELVNTGKNARVFVVEDVTWEDDAVHPDEIFSRADFREAFVSDLLAPNLRVAAGAKTIVFTDIVHSEDIFHGNADAGAFRILRDHFAAVDRIVAKREGAIVKTTGDGCMLVFDDPEQAVRATFDIAAASRLGQPPLLLRASVHTGSCLLANIHGSNDFFGKTVIFAARMIEAAPAQRMLISGQTLNTGLVKTAIFAHTSKLDPVEIPGALSKFGQSAFSVPLN
jgi:class 3 adenylate cyclase